VNAGSAARIKTRIRPTIPFGPMAGMLGARDAISKVSELLEGML
jgi:hypothetical protein